MELGALDSNEPQATQFSRQELYDLVWTEPISKIAPRFGLSGAGLSKICARHKIPTPGRGYWQRVRHGHRVKKKPLPKLKDDDDLVDLTRSQRRSTMVAPVEEGPVADQKRFEAEEENQIKVSETLHGMHPLVRQTRDVWKRRRARDYSYRQNLPPTLNIRVSDDSERRALLIMNTLLKALDKRGFPTEIGSGRKHPTVVTVHGEEIEIGLRERKKKVEREPTEWEREFSWNNGPYYDLEYSGRLTLKIDSYTHGGRRSWTDGKIQRVEKCLNSFVVALVATAEKAKEWRNKREELARKTELERQARLEEVRLQELQEERVSELRRQVDSWVRTQQIKSYIAALNSLNHPSQTPSGPDLSPTEWLKWASKYAEDLDPLEPGRVA